MKNTKTKSPLTLAEVQRGASIFDRYFAIEQQQQICRLQSAGDFEGPTESEAIDKTIATLAAAALYVFQLDPIAADSFDRISKVVGTSEIDDGIINACINEVHDVAVAWTRERRAAEIGESPRSAKAEEAGT
jgi:uncharacterized protein (DUF488 family)